MILRLHTQTRAPVRQVCSALGVPRSSFYLQARPGIRQLDDQRIGAQIEAIFYRHGRRYGHRRIGHQLADQGVVCAPHRVRRIMRQRGLRAIQPKNFQPRTSDGKASAPAPNLLAAEPKPTRPNQAWAGDITFIPSAQGWLYLALVIDLYSRRIVGWKLANHMRADLVIQAFDQALRSRPKISAALFHSDRGSQYGSTAFRSVLKAAGFRQSMSAPANPYDNAWTESAVATLKRELLQGQRFDSLLHAQNAHFQFIEGYYNTIRKHSSLGYLSPLQFESLHFTKH